MFSSVFLFSATPALSEGNKMPETLTKRQREVLDFINGWIRERGYPPTLREIGNHFGIKPTHGVSDHLKALEKKGAIERAGLKSRAMRPVGHGAVVPLRGV